MTQNHKLLAPAGGTSQPEQGSEAGKLVLEYPQTMGVDLGDYRLGIRTRVLDSMRAS